MEITMPKPLEERMQKLLGEEFPQFIEAIKQKPARAIRHNPLKCSKGEMLKQLSSEGIEASRFLPINGAFLVKGGVRFSELDSYKKGFYFVQDLASMLPPIFLESSPGERALDLAAAPGAKATQIAAMMGNKGVFFAVESNRNRMSSLKFNLKKYGATNALAVPGTFLAQKFPEKFDKILADVPCSGEGIIAKDKAALKIWSEKRIRKNAKLQKKLLLKGFSLLKKGGMLVYSTCTYAPEENEEVVQHLVDKNEGAVIENISLKDLDFHKGITKWGDKEFSQEMKNCARIYPMDFNSEGFFIAKISKK
ncbi:MAG: RsmB/NOP family class I SAM-dependent RNA methyltransferase [Candidatus Diapherotrites archaeon]